MQMSGCRSDDRRRAFYEVSIRPPMAHHSSPVAHRCVVCHPLPTTDGMSLVSSSATHYASRPHQSNYYCPTIRQSTVTRRLSPTATALVPICNLIPNDKRTPFHLKPTARFGLKYSVEGVIYRLIYSDCVCSFLHLNSTLVIPSNLYHAEN